MLFHPFLIEMDEMEKVIFKKKYVDFVAFTIVIRVQDPIWRYVDLKSSTSNNAFLLKVFNIFPPITSPRLSR